MPRPWQARLWIFEGLHEKPQVVAMARDLNRTPHEVAYKLQLVWFAFQKKADETGLLRGAQNYTIELIADCVRFGFAMEAVGWLSSTPQGLRLANFDEFVSKKAIKRIEDGNRKAGRREAGGGVVPRHTATCGDKVPVVTRQPRLPGTGKEKPTKPKPPPPERQPLFWTFWNAWPKAKRFNQAKAHDEWVKLQVGDDLLAKILAALEWQVRSEQWTKDGGTFIPLPANWLADRRWEDERPPDHRKTTRGPGVTEYAKRTLLSILEDGDGQPGEGG